MRQFAYLILFMALGCQEHSDVADTLPLSTLDSSPNGSLDREQKQYSKHEHENKAQTTQENGIRRANFGEANWVDVELKLTEVFVTDYISEFQKSGTLWLGFEGDNKFANEAELKAFCYERSYEKEQIFEGINGSMSAFVNPLNEFTLPRLVGMSLRETVTGVKNPFKISKKDILIYADFLNQGEKDLIIQNGAFEMFNELDYLNIVLFHPWDGPGRSLSSIITRLFCGIADKKASILYVFHNESGDTLKVRISGINFKLSDY